MERGFEGPAASPNVPRLKREVESPQHASTGLGVLVIVASAMFFAVAGSAFILRARIAAEAHHAPIPVMVKEIVVPAALDHNPERCGQPLYRENSDGSTTVTFKVCADADSLVTPR